MSRTDDEIWELYHSRMTSRGPIIAKMQEIRDTYNGDIAVPLPELDRNEQAAVANILNMGLDQTAMRIASTIPDVFCPPVKPGFDVHEQRAQTRRRTILGWWEMNRQRLKLRRRARWLIGYSCSPVLITPDSNRGIPKWNLRDPLTAYPAPTPDPDSVTTDNCIFSYRRSRDWIRRCYPEAYMRLPQDEQGAPAVDGRIQLLEYVDDAERVLIAVGKRVVPNDQYAYGSSQAPTTTETVLVRLETVPNRAGICPVVVPGRITLDRIMGQFDQILGMYRMQAKLMALSVIATQKGVFPETWLVAHPQETANITTQADPLEGIVGVVKGGQIVNMPINPSPLASQEIDRLERNQRIQAGVPAEFGGESTSNIRTGRRGDAVLSAVVDFPVQENQEILAASLEEENYRAVAVAKAYFGNDRKSFYVTWRGAQGNVDYTPNETFDTDRNTVSYSYAGADANNFVVGAGQRVGMGTMSKRSFMEIDPLIPDWEREHERVIEEQLEMAQMQAILQQSQAGAMPITAVARLSELVLAQETPLFRAIQQVQAELQAKQATSGEPGTPEAPAPPGAPEAQPGLNQPGTGDQQASVPPPPGGMDNLAMLMRALHHTGQAA